MAGDVALVERAVFTAEADDARGAAAPGVQGEERVVHRYGRLTVVADGPAADAAGAAGAAPADDDAPGDLTEVESLGLAAFRVRDSADYRQVKSARPRAGEPWDMPDCTSVVPRPVSQAAFAEGTADAAPAPGPTSAYLEGTVAVGIVIVEGPTPALQFTAAERVKVVAEVQNGLAYYAAENPVAGLSFTYDVHVVRIATPADPNAGDLEGLWREPAMAALGFPEAAGGVGAYAESLRTRFGTQWTYAGLFTKYPLFHFAYAWIGGPYLVMQYENDGWGPDNIDRVFAHETGHVFGCPDEYAASGCDCGGSWGRFGLANGNCENCAAESGVTCLMKGNDFELCEFTPRHLGWSARNLVRDFGYEQGWRVERHPRFVVDLDGDGRRDVVGFGDGGVWVSRGEAGGRFSAPTRVLRAFGYADGGWRVEKHPRFVADVTGDGRLDLVGLGEAGVYVARAQADGSYAPAHLVLKELGYAQGWRVERHPRLMADTTGDGRADIVGFADDGVYVARAQGDGGFAPAQRVVRNFGYDAGDWRVDQHPRFLVDTTGDGRLDIAGFGHGGLWVSRQQPDGSFAAAQRVSSEFGYGAGWRLDRHVRLLVDTTGDGRADIVGFGEPGVYVARAQAGGTFAPAQLVVQHFGYTAAAGSWRVERHPRFVADTTGDGRLDIAGFHDDGLWVARALGGGGYEPAQHVMTGFGYVDGGWRVERHPRLLVDTTGDGAADAVGFGHRGLWVAQS